jgi:hypothetical protein
MTTSNAVQSKQLEPLFEVQLQYKEGKPPVSSQGKVGEYIGSGEGTVSGLKIKGTVHWTLFEAQSETVCESNLFGVIETDDGARISFDTMGFFMLPDKGSPNQWVTSAAVSFDTEDERYQWLNTILGVWEGEFDMGTYRHHYWVYVRTSD